jgi:hypothetical protein
MELSHSEIIDLAAARGYKDITVAQLLEQLVSLPPMMPIFVQDHKVNDQNEPWVLNKYFTGLTLMQESSKGVPVLLLHSSTYPEAKRTYDDFMTQEEQEAYKREQARKIAFYMEKGSKATDFDK